MDGNKSIQVYTKQDRKSGEYMFSFLLPQFCAIDFNKKDPVCKTLLK